MVRIKTILLLFFIAGSQGVQAQKRFADTSTMSISLKSAADNTPQRRDFLARQWQAKGYLLAVCDSTAPKTIALKKGPMFDSFSVVWHTDSTPIQLQLELADLLSKTENFIRESENTGYPFAKVSYKVLEQKGKQITMAVFPEKGGYFLMDTFIFKGYQFGRRFIKYCSNISVDEPYNEQKITQLQARLGTIDGFQVRGKKELAVLNDKLQIFLPGEKVAKDIISGLVGLANSAEGNPVFTGELNARFYNMFRSGIYSGIEWRSFKARSQEFKFYGSVPYFIGLPFTTRFRLELTKFDTLYSTFSRELELRLPLGPHSGFTIGAGLLDRIRIYNDLETVKTLRQLPDNPGSKNSNYHLGYEYSTVLPGTLPYNGVNLTLQAGAGIRKFLRDPAIEAIQWVNAQGVTENVYDSLNRVGALSVNQYRLKADVAVYQRLLPWMVLKLAGNAMKYHAPTVYFNELERYGGIKNIRGFNEQSIFANEFYMGTIELRLMPDQNAFIGPFYHLAWFRNQSTFNSAKSGFLQGLGLVAGLKTGAGVLHFALAMGKSGSQSIGLNQSKFHLGISSAF